MNKIQQYLYLVKVIEKSCITCKISKVECYWRKNLLYHDQAFQVLKNLEDTSSFKEYIGGWVLNDKMICKEE